MQLPEWDEPFLIRLIVVIGIMLMAVGLGEIIGFIDWILRHIEFH